MIINSHITEGVLVIECEGRLNSLAVPSFKQQIIGFVNKGNHFILLDLDKTDFMDSSGLGVLVSLLKLVRLKDGEIKICRPNSLVQEILELTRFHLLFDVFNDVEQGMRSMKASQNKLVEEEHTNSTKSVL